MHTCTCLEQWLELSNNEKRRCKELNLSLFCFSRTPQINAITTTFLSLFDLIHSSKPILLNLFFSKPIHRSCISCTSKNKLLLNQFANFCNNTATHIPILHYLIDDRLPFL